MKVERIASWIVIFGLGLYLGSAFLSGPVTGLSDDATSQRTVPKSEPAPDLSQSAIKPQSKSRDISPVTGVSNAEKRP